MAEVLSPLISQPNADAPTRTSDGRLVFAKPLEEEQEFHEFLDYVISQENDASLTGEVRYAQTQNDNLAAEYTPLAAQVPTSIPFARIALERDPDAANLWIGNSRSATALHKDNYENIYVQIRGRKHFVLLPPLCFPVVREFALPDAGYERDEDGGLRLVVSDHQEQLLERHAHDESNSTREGVPFPTWDPDGNGPGVDEDDESMLVSGPYDDLVRPLRVTLEPGDMLYLPAMWYHKVSQSSASDNEGFVLAVNYWYDMDFSGPFYPLCNMVRTITQAQQRRRPEK